MEGAFVAVAGFWVSGTEGEVERAAHFFVEKDLSGRAVDRAIGSEGDLADSACPIVLIEHGNEKVLSLIGGDLGGAAFFHDDAGVADGVALVNTAFVEKHHAIGTSVIGFEVGSGIDFTIGKVFPAGTGEPAGPGDVDPEVGSGWGLEMEFAAGHELFSELALPAIEFLPEGDGVFLIELAGTDYEIAVILQAHSRVLGVGVGGEEGGGPEEGFERGIDGWIVGDGGALEEKLAAGAVGTCGALGDFGVEFIQGAKVG